MGRSYKEEQWFLRGSLLLAKHPENTSNHPQLPDKLQSTQERKGKRGGEITHPLKRWEDGEMKLYASCKSGEKLRLLVEGDGYSHHLFLSKAFTSSGRRALLAPTSCEA